MRFCTICEQEKSLAEFGTYKTRGKTYIRQRCRECLRDYDRIHTHKRYGITPEQYAEQLAAQHGVCAICKQPETTVQRGRVLQLAVDHDHVTGQVRGLLCMQCNQTLGKVGDSVERLKAMIFYLESGGQVG